MSLLREKRSMQNTSFFRTSQVYFIFMVSGASALIYQVIWSRWLGLIFGNTTTSISIVLGSFMLGLALGSWGIGRFLHRINNPLRVYAFMELGIGIFAVFFPFLTEFTDFIFTMAVSTGSLTTFSILARTLLAFSLLLVPTTLMGATLPLLTDFFRRNPRYTRSWKVGMLYAANTIGAALGIVLASFFLIELIGVSATTRTAAVLNLLIALVGFRLASSVDFVPGSEQENTGNNKLNINGKLAIAVLTASGAIALASEVLWTRTLETLVGNSTYAFSMIVLLYLVGIAAGSWAMSLIVNRLKQVPLWMASLQLGMGIWIFIALSLFDGITNSIFQYRGVLVPLSIMLWNYLKVMVVLLPLSLLSGACFPIATRIMDPNAEDATGVLIARAYAWNTAGAVAGSIIAGFIIAPFFDYFDSLYLLAFLYCITAFAVYLTLGVAEWQVSRMRLVYISTGIFSVVMLGIAFLKIAGSTDYAARFDAKHPLFQVVYHKQGLQGVTTVIKKRGEDTARKLLVNGMGMTVKLTDTKMMAHWPMLLHPDPKDTLVICFGMGTTYRSAISHGGNVTVVELVKEVLGAFDYFYKDASRVRSYAKGRMIVNDGRNYLKLTQEKYDVITIDPPPPIDAAGVNSLYSKEFLELAKTHLKRGGIMAQWIPFPGSQAGVDDNETYKMLFYTFTDVFPYVYFQRGYHNVGMHVLGSLEPLENISMHILEKRLSQEVISDIREWDAVPLAYLQGIRRFERTDDVYEIITTDDRPYLEFYLLRTWKMGGKKSFASNFW
jgi:spermidine synthase